MSSTHILCCDRLCYINADDLKAIQIAYILSQKPALMGLTIIGPHMLSEQGLTNYGATIIINSVGAHRSIKKLDLSGNQKITDEVVPAIIEMLKNNPSLQEFNISGCGLKNNGLLLIEDYLESNPSAQDFNFVHDYSVEAGLRKKRMLR